MSEQRYALRSKPNKEEALWRELFAPSYEAFYPQIHMQQVNPRTRKVRPYFPGYLFINVELPTVGYSTSAWMPHSNGLVSFDSEPAFVPAALISALRRHVEAVKAAGGELFDGLKQGEVSRSRGRTLYRLRSHFRRQVAWQGTGAGVIKAP